MFLELLPLNFIHKFYKCCIWILERFPFISPFFAFSIQRHIQAFKKFMVLWIMCTLPIIMAAALTKKPEGAEPNWGGFFDVLSVSFSAPEQFVYAAAFLPPLIYLYIERHFEAEKDVNGKRLSIRNVFNGYWPVFGIALVILLITMITYALAKTNFNDQQTCYYQLYKFTFEKAWYVYGISLYCWYLSILDGTPDKSDFLKDNEQAEKKLIGQFSDRIKTRAVK